MTPGAMCPDWDPAGVHRIKCIALGCIALGLIALGDCLTPCPWVAGHLAVQTKTHHTTFGLTTNILPMYVSAQ